ncbi:MAG: acetate/propionate family kinase [Oscillospiraceae bacterium]|nr:acetate/propionate family kinase [Oscillospiraceae bacterium]
MKVLVSNVGSTSLKFKLFDLPEERVLCEAKVERVGNVEDAIYSYKNIITGYSEKRDKCSVPDYSAGIKMFLDSMTDKVNGVVDSTDVVEAVGFKTVLAKGYYGIHELTEDVLNAMKDFLFVAPAHNAPYLEAIAQFREVMPKAVPVGVFETAFHTTIPLARRMYTIPYEWYEKYGIMRMGYHGASHSYIAEQAKAPKVISCHLGGSCSVCAIENGKSVDSSFGFSLQTGIPHANRVGDVDPYIIPFLMNEGMSMDEVLRGMSKTGGMLGLSGVGNDMREIEDAAAAGNERAELALDVFATSIIRHIGSYYAELGGLDKLVFTGGIGENSGILRKKICSGLKHMGIVLDEEANSKTRGEGIISTADSPVTVAVIAANEELGVARRTYNYILNNK